MCCVVIRHVSRQCTGVHILVTVVRSRDGRCEIFCNRFRRPQRPPKHRRAQHKIPTHHSLKTRKTEAKCSTVADATAVAPAVETEVAAAEAGWKAEAAAPLQEGTVGFVPQRGNRSPCPRPNRAVRG